MENLQSLAIPYVRKALWIAAGVALVVVAGLWWL
ncbi:hypothetical protein X732_33200 [Mesorhizobium sp. L2C066B000]|nr:hypothetical protein X732_33200 [Mesorhizobium sp. L2C066B000]